MEQMKNNVISLDSILSLTQLAERDIRKYGYNPDNPNSADAYWSDLWCEYDLEDWEPLQLGLTIGQKKFKVFIMKEEE